jgi:very-short-patch-repair endonuclease
MAGTDHVDALVRSHGGVLSTTEAARAGLSTAALKWAVKTGTLRRLRTGVYTSATLWHQASVPLQHLLLILAQQRVHPDLVACGTSAAVVLGLPTPDHAPPERPQLTEVRDDRRRGARGNQADGLRRRAWLMDDEVQTLGGARITSVTRTVLDCARQWPRPWGLAIADAALHRGDLDCVTLLTAANARAPAPGTGRCRWVADHARAEAESPLESLVRALVVLAGLPEPALQVWVQTRAGPFRVDLMDKANRTIIEADGKLKYAAAEDLWQEKRREDALRECGFEVVRFTMHDYHHPTPWLQAYRRALSRGARRQFG